jgi:ubiquitin C-terminal hydrolase
LSAEKNDDGTTQIYAESPRVLYDLFATVNHRGTLHQGHYTSNVKCGNHWYHCNDAFVCDAGEGNGEKEVLLAEGAYMLFYRRKEKK